MWQQGRYIEKKLIESQHTLEKLKNPPEYYQEQWQKQRECQMSISVNETSKKLYCRLEELVELEEQLHQAQYVTFPRVIRLIQTESLVMISQRFQELQNRRKWTWTQAEGDQLLNLPNTLCLLEDEIDSVVQQLGSEEFHNVFNRAGMYVSPVFWCHNIKIEEHPTTQTPKLKP